MLNPVHVQRVIRLAAIFALATALVIPSVAKAPKSVKAKARDQFAMAQKMREALNGLPASDRSRREYQRVMDAYRRVYYMAPTSSKADSSVVAVAELLAESGRAFDDEKVLRAAIGQYEFLRREYPGSKYRIDALFTIGQIYREDLDDSAKAKETFEEFLKHYPANHLAADAKDAIKEMDQEAVAIKKGKKPADAAREAAKKDEPKLKPAPMPVPEEVSEDRNTPVAKHPGLPQVTGIRHWSTPDYTRVAIDLETEIKYEAGRVPDPDRIFFDLHDTKLASTLVGKSFDVDDGFLKRIRVAQFQRGLTRVVLEVDDVAEYSAFLLPNPYRLIIDIHGRKPQTLQAKKAEQKQERIAEQKQKAEDAKEDSSNTSPSRTLPLSDLKAEQKKETIPSATAENKKPVYGPLPLPNAPKTDVMSDLDNKPAEYATKVIPKAAAAAKSDDELDDGISTKEEVANLSGPEKKATDKPTSEPTVEVVTPRVPDKKQAIASSRRNSSESHMARPTRDGDRSLIRALGLKIGKVVIDAGHGGHDTGTIGPSGLLEKDLVLDVALRLGRLLEKGMGADVVFTRDDDTFVPLETRTAIANKAQADLFVSVHANSSRDAGARGFETYYLNFTSSADALEVAARENAVSEKSIHELQDLVKKIALKEKIEESRELAGDVQKSMVTSLGAKDHALRDRGVKKAPFIVLIGANMPSILAEISFVSNPADERKLQTPEYRQKIAEALYRGIQRYVSGLSGVKLASKATSDEGQ